MFKRLALTAVLALAGMLVASAPANAGESVTRHYTGTHSCCSGGMYLRSSTEGYVFTSGDKFFGDTDAQFKVWDRREDGLCARVWVQGWNFQGVELFDDTATDCDSNPSSYAIIRSGHWNRRTAHFLYTVGRIRRSDGHIDYTRYGPDFIPGS
jgi:hypothetical protein